MRLKIRITTKYDPLNIRTGPGTSFKVVGTLPIGTEYIVNEQRNVGIDLWYKLEDGRGWICSKPGSVNYFYATVIENLEQNVQTKPVEDPIDNTVIDETLVSPQTKKYKEVVDETLFVNQFKIIDKKTGSVYGTNNDSTTEDYDKIQYELTKKDGFPKYIDYDKGVGIYDYFMDYEFIEKELGKIKDKLNIFSDITFRDVNKSLFNNFNRYKINFPDYNLTNTVSYIFITRPDLNILEKNGENNFKLTDQFENDPFYGYLYKNNLNILLSLSSMFSSQHDFHPFLSNTAGSFEVSDQYIKTIEHGETLTGYKVQYGKHNIESKTAGKFNISYIDDKELTIYKTHKAWTEYISRAFRGEISPKRTYIHKKILDYACSIYYILCAQDYETILFWTKYYGVFPTNEPSSVFSWSKGNNIKNPEYSIDYSYAFKEDFNPLTLCEFNMNSSGNYTYLKSYNENTLTSGPSITSAPFIETVKNESTPYIFKLRFRK